MVCRRVHVRSVLILTDKRVRPCPCWRSREGLGKRTEQQCHCPHAAQRARLSGAKGPHGPNYSLSGHTTCTRPAQRSAVPPCLLVPQYSDGSEPSCGSVICHWTGNPAQYCPYTCWATDLHAEQSSALTPSSERKA